MSRLTAHEARKVAVVAAVDPRTIQQYLAGKAKSTTSARIEDALRKLGFVHLLRPRSAA